MHKQHIPYQFWISRLCFLFLKKFDINSEIFLQHRDFQELTSLDSFPFHVYILEQI